MEFQRRTYDIIVEKQEYIRKNYEQIFNNDWRIIENWDNNYDIEYFQIQKTIILFSYYGYEFMNTYNYHINKLECILEEYRQLHSINTTKLQIYMNSLYIFINNEKSNGVLMKHVIDFVAYYLSKYSDILYPNDDSSSDDNGDDNGNDNGDDCRMKNIIEQLELLNELFVYFDCRVNLDNIYENLHQKIISELKLI